ncbi:MAG TPA: hypothetical protein PKD72_02850, partial [Gemmatales bacterium]|nr:hypothetical protein [Gemmatales bacterium]
MGLLDWFRPQHRYIQRAEVTVDASGVQCRRPNGLVEGLARSDLHSVYLRTTDAGPRTDDVFWVLEGKESGCEIPSEAVGVDALLQCLQQLPGFD